MRKLYWILLSISVVGCGGGSTSSGVSQSPPPPNNQISSLSAFALLAPIDRMYVEKHLTSYSYRPSNSGVDPGDGHLYIGEDNWSGWNEYGKAAVLVHEACHIAHRHTLDCSPAGERLCNAEMVNALWRAYEYQGVTADYGLINYIESLDGTHCYD